MHLDPATFFAMFFLLAVLNGGLLILGWLQNRSVTALAYWATAHLTAGFAMIALAAGVANPVFTGIGMLAGVMYDQITCKLTDGQHTVSAEKPFGLSVYGYYAVGSYAFVGGSDVKIINPIF